jgi:Uma2 family endonuclease
MTRPELKPETVHYPETDGQPMAESDLHRDLMLDLIAAARYHVRAVPDVYVSGNLLVYYEEGNPRKSVAPDFFVVRGVRKGRRRIYKIWEEAKGPELVIELTSPSTHREDLGKKLALYEALRVQEYFIFDPWGIRFQPQLRGLRLERGVFTPVAATRRDDGMLILSSEIIGLELHGRGESVRWVDPSDGKPVPIPEELLQAAEEERQRAETERVRAETERVRADAERERADAERERAETERKRADAAESELARLREEIARLRTKPQK